MNSIRSGSIERTGLALSFTDSPPRRAVRHHTASFDYTKLIRDGEPTQSLDVLRQALTKLAEVAPPRASVQVSYPCVYAHWEEDQ